MKILYAFQGTGNGHAARARALLPELAKYAEVEVATSGMNSELNVGFPIKYRFKGVSYENNGKGGISHWDTVRSFGLRQAFRDVKSVPIHDYDVVLNDFEPITAYAARRGGVPSIAASHQAAFLSKSTPRPDTRDFLAEAVFKFYAPSEERVAFHFERYDSFIIPPILREEIRRATPANLGHITVYLPGFDDQNLLPLLHRLAPKPVHLFSRLARGAFNVQNVSVQPISHETFVRSLVECDALLAGAGFEGPAEALHLGKKLMVVPLAGQYEQRCNAAALAQFGVPVMSTIDERNIDQVREWACNGRPVELRFENAIPEAVDRLLHLAERLHAR